MTRRLSKHNLTEQGDLNIEMLVSETVIRLIIGLLLQLRISIGSLTPPDMENVENRRISVRTYRLLAILSCHRDVLQDSLFILKTAYRQKSDL